MKRTLVALAALAVASIAFGGETRQRYTIATSGALKGAALRMASDSEDGASRHVRRFTNIDGFAADLTAEEAKELRQSAGVVSVDPVVERHVTEVGGRVMSNLESYSKQIIPWGIDAIHARQVWPVTKGEGINVVVLDTGIDFNHPDLKAVYAGGYNVLSPADPPMDDLFHGTHVAGTIAAQDNAFGVVGAAPGVKLWAVKALNAQGKGFDEGIALGIDWIISKAHEVGGRWVVNMSFGSAVRGGNMEEAAISRAYDAGIIMIAAAGNDGHDFLEFPAAYAGVIPVGAVNDQDIRADFSNFGYGIDAVGPGVDVPSCVIDGVEEGADIIVGDTTVLARGLIGSPFGVVTGRIVDAKLGRPDEFTAAVNGNIALIKRGELDFREKVRNAKNAGAKAVVIWNSDPTDAVPAFTLLPRDCDDPDDPECPDEWKNYQFILSMNVTKADGIKLQGLANQNATASFFSALYSRKSGTSMATPHVAAAAALVLALKPDIKPVDMNWLIRRTARDLGDEGWDYQTSYGMVDALAAAKFVAPERFGVPQPSTPITKRRSSRP
jgi:subtilisin family serine protease